MRFAERLGEGASLSEEVLGETEVYGLAKLFEGARCGYLGSK